MARLTAGTGRTRAPAGARLGLLGIIVYTINNLYCTIIVSGQSVLDDQVDRPRAMPMRRRSFVRAAVGPVRRRPPAPQHRARMHRPSRRRRPSGGDRRSRRGTRRRSRAIAILSEDSARFANHPSPAQGIQPGDRVAIMLRAVACLSICSGTMAGLRCRAAVHPVQPGRRGVADRGIARPASGRATRSAAVSPARRPSRRRRRCGARASRIRRLRAVHAGPREANRASQPPSATSGNDPPASREAVKHSLPRPVAVMVAASSGTGLRPRRPAASARLAGVGASATWHRHTAATRHAA